MKHITSKYLVRKYSLINSLLKVDLITHWKMRNLKFWEIIVTQDGNVTLKITQTNKQ